MLTFFADLFSFVLKEILCFLPLKTNKADVTEAFNSAFRYLDDPLNIDNIILNK